MDRGAWRATVQGVAKRRTGLSDFTRDTQGPYSPSEPQVSLSGSQDALPSGSGLADQVSPDLLGRGLAPG